MITEYLWDFNPQVTRFQKIAIVSSNRCILNSFYLLSGFHVNTTDKTKVLRKFFDTTQKKAFFSNVSQGVKKVYNAGHEYCV